MGRLGVRKNGVLIEASCKQTNEGFVVLKGSVIGAFSSDNLPKTIKSKREKSKINEFGILEEDILFKSPSYAASFVTGSRANGLIEWKTKDGKTLKEIENNEGL